MTPPRILPPHYFLLCLLLIIAIGLLEGGRILPAPWPWLGLLPIAIGIWMAAQGSRQFAREGTSIIPFSESTALVTNGVFSFSRNPMYTGMTLTLAGTALILNGLLPWLPVLAFVAVIRGLFIPHEETLMEKTFGQAYLDYRTRVRRWL